MDWPNEEYVRLYTRETADDLELSWGAISLWRAMLIKFDRSGLIAAKNGWRSIAAVTRFPVDVTVQVGPELIADGRVLAVDGGFLAPNFIEAQTASKSDKVRQRDSRDRRRLAAGAQVIDITSIGHAVSHDVTPSHEPSQNVTLPLLSPPVAEPLLIPPDKPAARTRSRDSKPLSFALTGDWSPRSEERAKAVATGLNCDAEADAFRDHHAAKGSRLVDWNAAFRTWLRNAVKFSRFANARPNEQPIQSKPPL